MERHELLEMMAQLKLAGMRATYDDILAAGLKRRHPVQQIIGALFGGSPPIGWISPSASPAQQFAERLLCFCNPEAYPLCLRVRHSFYWGEA